MPQSFSIKKNSNKYFLNFIFPHKLTPHSFMYKKKKSERGKKNYNFITKYQKIHFCNMLFVTVLFKKKKKN